MTAEDAIRLIEDTRDEIKSSFAAESVIIHDKIASLQYLAEDIKKIKEEIAVIKTQSIVRSRVAASSVDNMTPFAQRLAPVQPNRADNPFVGGAK